MSNEMMDWFTKGLEELNKVTTNIEKKSNKTAKTEYVPLEPELIYISPANLGNYAFVLIPQKTEFFRTIQNIRTVNLNYDMAKNLNVYSKIKTTDASYYKTSDDQVRETINRYNLMVDDFRRNLGKYTTEEPYVSNNLLPTEFSAVDKWGKSSICTFSRNLFLVVVKMLKCPPTAKTLSGKDVEAGKLYTLAIKYSSFTTSFNAWFNQMMEMGADLIQLVSRDLGERKKYISMSVNKADQTTYLFTFMEGNLKTDKEEVKTITQEELDLADNVYKMIIDVTEEGAKKTSDKVNGWINFLQAVKEKALKF